MRLPLLAPPESFEDFPTWVVERDDQLRMVVVTRQRWSDQWRWSVVVAAAEFVRESPLEERFASSIERALRGVPGAKRVAREDREVWQIEGFVSGFWLAVAAARVARDFVPEIEATLTSSD